MPEGEKDYDHLLPHNSARDHEQHARRYRVHDSTVRRSSKCFHRAELGRQRRAQREQATPENPDWRRGPIPSRNDPFPCEPFPSTRAARWRAGRPCDVPAEAPLRAPPVPRLAGHRVAESAPLACGNHLRPTVVPATGAKQGALLLPNAGQPPAPRSGHRLGRRACPGRSQSQHVHARDSRLATALLRQGWRLRAGGRESAYEEDQERLF